LKLVCEEINEQLIFLYKDTLWKSIVFLLCIWLPFTLWFIDHDTYFYSFLAVLFGTIVMSTSIFIALKFSILALLRTMVDANKGRGFMFASSWISSLSIAGGAICIQLVFYLLLVFLAEELY